MENIDYIAGIDEAGRGPLAGPVAVGIVVAEKNFNMDHLADAADSKQLTETRRESVHERFLKLTEHHQLQADVFYRNAAYIDEHGIVAAIQDAIAGGLDSFADLTTTNTKILLDGSLQAPDAYKKQEAITKGDAKEPLISTASIFAKVQRDRKMVEYHDQYPQYGFDSHKGYPTPQHYRALAAHGSCTIHREGYLTKE